MSWGSEHYNHGFTRRGKTVLTEFGVEGYQLPFGTTYRNCSPGGDSPTAQPSNVAVEEIAVESEMMSGIVEIGR